MKRGRRGLVASIAAGMMLVGVIQSSPAETADPSLSGQWGAPFSENGRFDAAPPQTPAEANELPAAVSVHNPDVDAAAGTAGTDERDLSAVWRPGGQLCPFP